MSPALDEADRIQALVVSAGIPSGGPMVPVTDLAPKWTKPRSPAAER
jgi:hypothetical protein